MTEEHRHHLGPAGEALGPSFCLVLGDQVSKFSTGKMMKKLTKQACYLYHVSALLVIVMRNLLAQKSYNTIHLEGILFKSYFGQD
jgi:hypothetical protein